MSKSSVPVDVYNPTKVLNSALSILGPNTASLLEEDVIVDRDISSEERLFTLICNYLSLSQFELARHIITEQFFASPERITCLLRSIVVKHVPEQWLFANVVPSVGHLQWLALVEYGQLYANVFDKPVSLTPTIPLVVGSKDTRFLSLSQSSMLSENCINPLGFVTHDQLVVQIAELNLRKVLGAEVYTICHIELATKNLTSAVEDEVYTGNPSVLSPLGRVEFTPPTKHHTNISLADSKLVIQVYSIIPILPGTDVHHYPNSVEKDKKLHVHLGKVIVNLLQLRTKEKFHIWVPIISHDSVDSANAEKQLGRIRLRLRWKQKDLVPKRDGTSRLFCDKQMWSLETDLLFAHASLQQDPAATAQNVPLMPYDHLHELRSYCATGLGLKLKSALTNTSTDAAFQPISRVIRALPSLRKLIRDFPEIGHQLCSHIASVRPQDPTWVYLYSELIFEMLLREEYPHALRALATFVHNIYPGDEFYAAMATQEVTVSDQIAGPRTMVREIFRALVYYIHDDKQGRQHLLRLLTHKRLVTGIVSNSTQMEYLKMGTSTVLQKQRQTLARKCAVYGAFIGNEHLLRQFCSLEDFYLYGQPDAVSSNTTAAAANASTGTSNPYVGVISLMVSGKQDQNDTPVPGMVKEGVMYEIPIFFMVFKNIMEDTKAAQLDACSRLGTSVDNLPVYIQEPLFSQREDAYTSFWNEYYAYTRIRKHNVYEYPLKAVLEYISLITRIHMSPAWHSRGYACAEGTSGALSMYEKLDIENVFWRSIDLILTPFNMLRPMLLLLAWDRVESNYELRKLLLRYIWEPYQQTITLHMALYPKLQGDVTGDEPLVDEILNTDPANNTNPDTDISSRVRILQRYTCSEPKLILQCTRLQFSIGFADLILTTPTVRLDSDDEKISNLAKLLLDSMSSESFVKVIHPYLSEVDPAQALSVVRLQIENELNIDYINTSDASSTLSNRYAQVMQSWTAEQRALFAATGLAPDGQVLDPVLATKIVNKDTSNAVRYALSLGAPTNTPAPGSEDLMHLDGDVAEVNGGALLKIKSNRLLLHQAVITDLVHDLHVLSVYYVLRSILTLLQYEVQQRRVSESDKYELLDTAKTFFLSMQYRSYQVSCLEKMYSLLFTTVEDLKTSVAMHKDVFNEGFELLEEQEEFLDIDFVLHANSRTTVKARYVLQGPLLLRVLELLSSIADDLVLYTNRDNVTKPHHVQENNLLLERLSYMRTQLMEARWRANTLNELESDSPSNSKLSQKYTMLHLTAPLHYVSTYLMHKQRIEDAVIALPMPTLPIEVVRQAKDAEDDANRYTEDFVNLFIGAEKAFPVTVNAKVPEYLTNLCAMLKGGYTSLSTQMSHAATIAKNEKLWVKCCGFVDNRLESLIQATKDFHWAEKKERDVDEKVGEYETALFRKRADELSKGKKAGNVEDVDIQPSGDLTESSRNNTKHGKKYSSNTPHRFAIDLAHFIEQHSVINQDVDITPTKDVLFESQFIITMDLAISYADRLPAPHYLALINIALEHITCLKHLYETALLTYLSEASIASLSAAVRSAPNATKEIIQVVLNNQEALKTALQARLKVCDILIEFTVQRQDDKGGVAMALIPSSIIGNDDVMIVAENTYYKAWKHFIRDVKMEEDALLPSCPWSGTSSLHVMRRLVVSVMREDILLRKDKLNQLLLNNEDITRVGNSINKDNFVNIGAKGYVDSCSYIISGLTQNLLSRAMLPALVAVRFGLPKALLACFEPKIPGLHKTMPTLLDETVAIALHYTRGIPNLSKWIKWRVDMYRRVAQLLEITVNLKVHNTNYGNVTKQPLSAFRILSMNNSVDPTTPVATSFSNNAMPIDLHELESKVHSWIKLLSKENPYKDQSVMRSVLIEYLRLITVCEQHGEKLYTKMNDLSGKRAPIATLSSPSLNNNANNNRHTSPHHTNNTGSSRSRSNSVVGKSISSNDPEENPNDTSLMSRLTEEEIEVLKNHRRQLTAIRLTALELMDTGLDDEGTKRKVVSQLMGTQDTMNKLSIDMFTQKQTLLADLIADLTEETDQPLRAQLLMRLENPVIVARQTLKFLSRWKDVDMCLGVCLRSVICVATFVQTRKHQATPELMSMLNDLVRKYQILVIYKSLVTYAIKNAKSRQHASHAYMTGASYRLDMTEQVSKSALVPEVLQATFFDWTDLDARLTKEPERTIETLLGWNMQGISVKCYALRIIPYIYPDSSSNIQALLNFTNVETEVTLPDQEVVKRRWFYGQEIMPLQLLDVLHDITLPTAVHVTSGYKVGITDTTYQLESPLAMYHTWLSVMSNKEVLTKSTPEGFTVEDQQTQFRLAMRLEGASLAILLSSKSPNRAHLRGLRRLKLLDTMADTFTPLQIYSVYKRVIMLVDNAPIRLMLIEQQHHKWCPPSVKKGTIEKEGKHKYPGLPVLEAEWLTHTLCSCKMLGQLPTHVQQLVMQLNIGGVEGTKGLGHLCSPYDVLYGLFISGQPQLAMTVFRCCMTELDPIELGQIAESMFTKEYKDKHDFNMLHEKQHTKGVGAHEGLNYEVAFLYFNMVLQYRMSEDQLSTIGGILLSIVETLVKQDTNPNQVSSNRLVNRVIGPKLLKFYSQYCANIKNSQQQAKYVHLSSICLSGETDTMLVNAAREGALEPEEPVITTIVHNLVADDNEEEMEEDEDYYEDEYEDEDEEEEQQE